MRETLARLFPRLAAPSGEARAIVDAVKVGQRPAPSQPMPIRIAPDHGPIPVYPMLPHGIPATAPRDLIATQSGLVAQLRDGLALEDDFERLVLPALLRFAAFVHLLPASESDHHCAIGGLLRHSLEVAYFAGRGARGLMFGLDLSPDQRRAATPRWRLAACLAGLLHDLGKPITDIQCLDASGKSVWNPHSVTLHDWATRQGIDRYFIVWQPGRHGRHVAMGVARMHEILGQDLIDFLSLPSGNQVIEALLGAISGSQDPTNPLVALVREADCHSTEQDLIAQASRLAGDPDAGLRSASARIVTQIRRLLSDGEWRINAPGHPVLWTTEGLFLQHPDALAGALRHLRDRGQLDVPSDPGAALNLLLRSHFIEPYERNGQSCPTWLLEIERERDGLHMSEEMLALRVATPEALTREVDMPAPLSVADKMLVAAAVVVAHAEVHAIDAHAAAVPPVAVAPLPGPDVVTQFRGWLESQGSAGVVVMDIVDGLIAGRLRWRIDLDRGPDRLLCLRYPSVLDTGLRPPAETRKLLEEAGWVRSHPMRRVEVFPHGFANGSADAILLAQEIFEGINAVLEQHPGLVSVPTAAPSAPPRVAVTPATSSPPRAPAPAPTSTSARAPPAAPTPSRDRTFKVPRQEAARTKTLLPTPRPTRPAPELEEPQNAPGQRAQPNRRAKVQEAAPIAEPDFDPTAYVTNPVPAARAPGKPQSFPAAAAIPGPLAPENFALAQQSLADLTAPRARGRRADAPITLTPVEAAQLRVRAYRALLRVLEGVPPYQVDSQTLKAAMAKVGEIVGGSTKRLREAVVSAPNPLFFLATGEHGESITYNKSYVPDC